MFRLKDWYLLGPAGLVAILLGWWGYMVCASAHCATPDAGLALLQSFNLVRGGGKFLPGTDPWQLVIAQFLIPGVALFGGAKLLLANFRRDMRVAFARRARDHVIVCGLGDTGREIVQSLHDAGRRVVAIDLDVDTDNAVACERLGLPVLKGDAAQVGLLKLAGLDRATALVVTTGTDAINLEVGLRARDAVEARPGRSRRLDILPEMRSDWLFDAILANRTASLSAERTEFRIFNLYASAARQLMRQPGFRRVVPGSVEPSPHVIIAGFGQMGAEILARVVRSAFAVPGMRAAITVLDQRGAEASQAYFSARPGLAALADISFVECAFALEDPAAWKTVDETLAARPARAVIIAVKEDDVGLNAALQFRNRLDRLRRTGTPVYVRLREQPRLGQFMVQLEAGGVLRDRLVPFGDLGFLTRPSTFMDESFDALARAAHATYLAGVKGAATSPANQPWQLLAEYYKNSNRLFADHIPVKLRHAGLRLVEGKGEMLELTTAEVEALAMMEHWRWCIELRLFGGSYGPKRDDTARVHPLLVEWGRLPEEAREGNREMVRRIPAIAEGAGYAVRREAVIQAAGPRRDGAEAALAQLGPQSQAIIVADPADRESWAIARRGVERQGAKIWALWREGSPPPAIEGAGNDGPSLAPYVESWVSGAELAAIEGGSRLPPPPEAEAPRPVAARS